MNILMINQDQFGYKAGYYHYCKHLVKQGHKITYLCNDHGLPKMNIDGIRVIYVKEPSSIKWRKIFLSKIKELKAQETIDVALCSYFRGCSILKTISKGLPIVIDVRSGDLSKNVVKRKLYNRIIKFEASLFSHIMILSGSLAKLLKLKEGSYDVVPLGADEISDASRQYEAIKMLYVGTLQQRDIHKTVEGLADFCKKYPEADIEYDIIGFGLPEEEALINQTIVNNDLSNKVFFHGRVNYENLKPFFDKANLGIAFVPMTPYYDCQPSTKIYEYVLSGMYCIATNTYENRILIEPINGLICDDNPESFSEALVRYYKMNKISFDSEKIKQSMSQYLWESVIKDKLLQLLERQCDGKC